jgi:hypothetical protein
MELRNQQVDTLISDMKTKEKIREKGFSKFVKTETGRKKDQFMKWSTRRYEAKIEYERNERDKEDTSYLT